MKFNRKLLIPVFATAMGLSLIGGIGGTVAWYQYNSKVTASYVGASVADTGVLQIGVKKNGSYEWGRDVRDMDLQGKNKLYPVTFGQLDEDEVPANGKMYPEAGQYAYNGWQSAVKGTHYAQFELAFRAFQTNPEEATKGYTAVERDVYITESILKCVKLDGVTEDDTKIANEALRIHLQVKDQPDVFLSNSGSTAQALYGPLDLDRNEQNDTFHETLFNPTLPTGKHDGNEIEYGINGEKETTKAISDVLASRDATSGSITGGQKLFKTTSNENAPVEVVMTVWLEGWAFLQNKAEWNPYYSAGCKIQAGLQFDTGIFRGSDLNTLTSGQQQQNP